MLTDSQIERYSRQIILPEIGGRGQEALLSASVAIVGIGELASVAGLYLAAAGIGTLATDPSTAHVLELLNPDCQILVLPSRLDADTVTEVVRNHEVIVDAGAFPPASAQLNAACVSLSRPLVWGRARGCIGRVTIFAGHQPDVPCYQCLQLEPPAASTETGTLHGLAAVTAGFIGSAQATEVIKIILGIDLVLAGRMLVYDCLDPVIGEVRIHKDPQCVTCGRGAARRHEG